MPEQLREDASPDAWAADLALVGRVLGGDPDARATFAERAACVPRFQAAVNARLGMPLTREDLADLAQDTLVLIWRKLGTFEGRATLESWCWRFCQLELANRVRLKRRRGALVLASGQAGLDRQTAAEAPLNPVEFDHLERGLQALGPPEEDVIRLKHFEHLKFSEIAARLNIRENTAKTRYYRGITWLKDFLTRRGEGEG